MNILQNNVKLYGGVNRRITQHNEKSSNYIAKRVAELVLPEIFLYEKGFYRKRFLNALTSDLKLTFMRKLSQNSFEALFCGYNVLGRLFPEFLSPEV
jgi:hypothetical protein